jgi:hypothetical protein
MSEFQINKMSFLKLSIGDEARLLVQVDEDRPVESRIDSGGWRIGGAEFTFTEDNVSVVAGTVDPLTVNLLLDFLEIVGFNVSQHEKSFFLTFRMDKLDGVPLLHLQTNVDLEKLVRQFNLSRVLVLLQKKNPPLSSRGIDPFSFKFDPIKVLFNFGFSYIVLNSSDDKPCIQLRLTEHGLDLMRYFYKVDKKTCPYVTHEAFFKILDFFSYFFDKKVGVKDNSVKVLNDCTLDVMTMSLVKNKTFYNRYGFENATFAEKLEEIGKSVNTKTKELRDLILQNSLSKNTSVQHLAKKILSGDATLKETAIFFYTLCEQQHPLTSKEEFKQAVNVFQLHPFLNQFFGVFIKPVTTQRSTHKLSCTFSGEYILRILIMPSGGKRTRIKLKKRIGSRHKKR